MHEKNINKPTHGTYIIDAKNVLKNNKRKLKEKMHTHCKQKNSS